MISRGNSAMLALSPFVILPQKTWKANKRVRIPHSILVRPASINCESPTFPQKPPISQHSAQINCILPICLDFSHSNVEKWSFSEKKAWKIWWNQEKAVPLHSLSGKRYQTPLERRQKERVLWQDLHKQKVVVQEASEETHLGNKRTDQFGFRKEARREKAS